MKRLSGKPFVLLGVNSDANKALLQKIILKEKIVWRNWFDGGGKAGPIATNWQIGAWPTLFLIDAKGVIRHIESDGDTPDADAINKRIDTLLKELAVKKDN